ncbi:hypothetical protein Y032_0078g1150 [Ancylostoma ceylanicum]|uniref:Uncharacterized protein n=1 Tax=Ancylostoma ceylanicum TaxID=53326 RepID=A0A016TTB9_9BILA|nr:hypothetical protein Y032_0078g1150 [Ancylostoma ceylanicum]
MHSARIFRLSEIRNQCSSSGSANVPEKLDSSAAAGVFAWPSEVQLFLQRLVTPLLLLSLFTSDRMKAEKLKPVRGRVSTNKIQKLIRSDSRVALNVNVSPQLALSCLAFCS